MAARASPHRCPCHQYRLAARNKHRASVHVWDLARWCSGVPNVPSSRQNMAIMMIVRSSSRRGKMRCVQKIDLAICTRIGRDGGCRDGAWNKKHRKHRSSNSGQASALHRPVQVRMSGICSENKHICLTAILSCNLLTSLATPSPLSLEYYAILRPRLSSLSSSLPPAISNILARPHVL